MGAVFAATDLGQGRRIALTAIEGRHAGDPTIRQRFVDQASHVSHLDHPHIANIYAWGEVGDTMYLVSELVDGVTLAELGAHTPLPIPDALSLLTQIAGALDHAHQQGVTHHNLNPTNIVVTTDDTGRTAHLIRFGIATDLGSTTTRGVDSPGYTSPEQLAGERDIDSRTDVYSLAAVAYELLTGHPPYADPSTPDNNAADTQRLIPSAVARNTLLPAGVDAVVARGLANDRSERYACCSDLVKALRSTFPRSATESATAIADSAPSPPAAATTMSARHRWPIVVTAAALVVIAATTYLLANRQPGESSSIDSRPTSSLAPATNSAPSTTAAITTISAPSTTVTATTVPTSTTPTTVAVGTYGFPVGAAVSEPTGPEAAYALALQQRTNPLNVALNGSPAMLYAQWIRIAGQPVSDAVTATADGFVVTADQPVTLQGFQIQDGLISSFTECTADNCLAIDQATVTPPDCQPGPNCPHLRSRSGQVTAQLRATLTPRWPAQVLLYELVVASGSGRAISAVNDPNEAARYDPETGYLVILFADKPPPDTRHQLTITYTDATTDRLDIFYA